MTLEAGGPLLPKLFKTMHLPFPLCALPPGLHLPAPNWPVCATGDALRPLCIRAQNIGKWGGSYFLQRCTRRGTPYVVVLCNGQSAGQYNATCNVDSESGSGVEAREDGVARNLQIVRIIVGINATSILAF